MIKRLALLLALSPALFAALPAATTWEIRTTGSNGNGGCFITGASGTDFSQQNAAQSSGTNLASVSALVVSSVTHNFVATDVGNCIQISGGTGFTAGFYQIVSVAINQATLDRSPGTVGVNGVWAVGGALATPQTAWANTTALNTIYIKATANYVTTTNFAFSSTAGDGTFTIGYTTTRGDNGQATLTTATNATILLNFNGNALKGINIANMIFSNSAGTRAALWQAGPGADMFNLICTNCVFDGGTLGIDGSNVVGFKFPQLTIVNSEIKNCTSHGIDTGGGLSLWGSYVHNNAGNGINIRGFTGISGNIFIENSIIKSNTLIGVMQNSANGSDLFVIKNSDIINNGSDGIQIINTSTLPSGLLWNVLLDSNGGFGINNASGATAVYFSTQNNAFWNNTSGARSTWPVGSGDVNLTGDPLVNRAGNNFALNNTAGAGASMRGAGFPGILQVGGTGAADIGALQHVAAAGGGQVGFGFTQ